MTGPADTDTAAEAAEIITDFIEHWDRSHEVVSVGLPQLPQLRISHLRAVLGEREQLAARTAELEAEREGDTDAVRGALIALDVLRVSMPGPAQRRVAKLYARFADRIAALGQQNDAADGSAR